MSEKKAAPEISVDEFLKLSEEIPEIELQTKVRSSKFLNIGSKFPVAGKLNGIAREILACSCDRRRRFFVYSEAKTNLQHKFDTSDTYIEQMQSFLRTSQKVNWARKRFLGIKTERSISVGSIEYLGLYLGLATGDRIVDCQETSSFGLNAVSVSKIQIVSSALEKKEVQKRRLSTSRTITSFEFVVRLEKGKVKESDLLSYITDSAKPTGGIAKHCGVTYSANPVSSLASSPKHLYRLNA